eukprot:CAMPEP_0172600530 /NCGR_PEP_ID=MMETSP1068-20121228/20724_1 /TAXON_ID=35684 /ORGANISM="Pseudopedinella elastica, Strain CCMP716" /LENGTH=94 /DNA_ID=CAMNT_0013401243 /DNA_START=359 /DNA_END=643 /DNA_ORIENTATION=-
MPPAWRTALALSSKNNISAGKFPVFRATSARCWCLSPSLIMTGDRPTTSATVRNSSTRMVRIHSLAQAARCEHDTSATGTPASPRYCRAARAPG